MVSREFSLGDYRREAAPKIKGTRPLRFRDNELIKSLVTEATKRLFGVVDVAVLLNSSYVRLGLENEQNDLVAAMILNNYPNIRSIPSWDWVPWLYNLYGIRQMSPRNTLWVHLTVYLSDYTKVFLEKMLVDIFQKYPAVEYVVFILFPRVKFTEWLVTTSIQVKPKDVDGKSTQTLHFYTRQKYTPSYKMRVAVVEDNDDIVTLIDSHSKRLRLDYGDFYVAEILKIDPTRKVIVAEHNEETVATICLNSVVNLDLLNEQFQLDPYNALKVPTKSDIFHPRPSTEPQEVSNDSSSPSIISAADSKVSGADDTASVATTHDLNAAMEEYHIPQQDDDIVSTKDDEEKEEDKGYVEVLDSKKSKVYLGYADPNFSASQLTYNHDEQETWNHVKRIRGSDAASAISGRTSVAMPTSTYRGNSNCFCLEIAASKPDHELCLRKLLLAGFELYPDRDYCVFSVPSTAPPFDLQANVFVRVPPRPRSTFPSELYVAHRSALCGQIYVRDAYSKDVGDVRNLLYTCQTGGTVYKEFLNVVISNTTNLARQAYVILCDNQVVGVAILSELYTIDYIKSHYDISRYTDLSKHTPGCFGELEYFVLSPIFFKHTRFIMLELHRLSDYSFLCYKISSGDDKKENDDTPLPGSLCFMLPVMPSKIPEFRTKDSKSDTWELPEALMAVEKPYALYVSTPIYCGGLRIEVNDKIVVVGASNAALAFLVDLAFQQESQTFATFNNLTLVSTHGLQICKGCGLKTIMIPTRSDIDGFYLSLISLTTYVNVIRGVMEGIDRKQKYITVNSSSVPYDILILTCGRQFLMPRRQGLCSNIYENPSNVFVINTAEDVEVATKKLKRHQAKSASGKVIVYGNTIESYCTVNCVLKLGFLPCDIVLVLPEEEKYAKDFTTTFNDPDIDRTVKKYTKNLGVTIYKGFSFYGWKFDVKHYGVTSVNFQSLRRSIYVPCLALFLYGKKSVSRRTFDAIHRAGLIYDGALVINPDFTTNDPDIYAAGTFTKYPRKYYADHMLHTYYDQNEIGRHLCQKISTRLLSLRIHMETAAPGILEMCRPPGKMLVPRYSNPVKVFARFPGNIHYFSLRKPGLITPYEMSSNEDNLGTILTTGTLKNLDKAGYFKLHLNSGQFVETITCLSKSHIETVNLTCVWGKHERLLNNLVTRYYMGLIADLFDYFAKPCMMAIYNNNFESLNKSIMEIMTSLTDVKGESPVEDVLAMFKANNWEPLTKIQEDKLDSKFMGSDYEKKIEEKVMEFLQNNHSFLPMYATPMVCNMIVANYQESPLFRPL